jgi:uncharacterized alkaline shock family protein YloU
MSKGGGGLLFSGEKVGGGSSFQTKAKYLLKKLLSKGGFSRPIGLKTLKKRIKIDLTIHLELF